MCVCVGRVSDGGVQVCKPSPDKYSSYLIHGAWCVCVDVRGCIIIVSEQETPVCVCVCGEGVSDGGIQVWKPSPDKYSSYLIHGNSWCVVCGCVACVCVGVRGCIIINNYNCAD